jgi:hypothetical protein
VVVVQSLPQFVPRATVEFKPILGNSSKKIIELRNPNAFPLRYHVTMEVSRLLRVTWSSVVQVVTLHTCSTKTRIGLSSLSSHDISTGPQQGHKDFQIMSETVELPAKSALDYSVVCEPRSGSLPTTPRALFEKTGLQHAS